VQSLDRLRLQHVPLLLHEDGVRCALVGSLTEDFHPITVAGQRWNYTILPPPDLLRTLRKSIEQNRLSQVHKKTCFTQGVFVFYCSTDLKGALN